MSLPILELRHKINEELSDAKKELERLRDAWYMSPRRKPFLPQEKNKLIALPYVIMVLERILGDKIPK